MTINDGSADINTVTTSAETCPLGTIWSGLVTLDPGPPAQEYTINLTTEGADGVFGWDGDFWWMCPLGSTGCTTLCAAYGGVKGTCQTPTDATCPVCRHFVGADKPCIVTDNYWIPVYRSTQQDCIACVTQECANISSCNDSWDDYQPFCTCNGTPLNFTFTFTAPAA